MGKFIDRTNHVYGDLTVVRFTRKNERNQAFWMCRCVCGNEKEVFSGNLNGGHTTSCGCRKKCLKHGNSGRNRTTEYNTFASMLQRCNNPNSEVYYLYGGRGIKVCDEWNGFFGFPLFLKHMGKKPTPQHTLDRWPDKNGDYEPGNVRWALPADQNRNTSRNVNLELNGETMCRKDLAAKFGIHQMTLKKRLLSGLTLQDAISKPVNTKMRNRKSKCAY